MQSGILEQSEATIMKKIVWIVILSFVLVLTACSNFSGVEDAKNPMEFDEEVLCELYELNKQTFFEIANFMRENYTSVDIRWEEEHGAYDFVSNTLDEGCRSGSIERISDFFDSGVSNMALAQLDELNLAGLTYSESSTYFKLYEGYGTNNGREYTELIKITNSESRLGLKQVEFEDGWYAFYAKMSG